MRAVSRATMLTARLRASIEKPLVVADAMGLALFAAIRWRLMLPVFHLKRPPPES